MQTTAPRVQTPLNLFLPIAPGHTEALEGLLAGLHSRSPNPVHVALNALGNVHVAQFVLLKDLQTLAVLTFYDGDFDDYIMSFVDAIGDLFDAILTHVSDGTDVIPVRQRSARFVEFIRQHDRPGVGLYAAYAHHRVFDIKDALRLP